MQGMEGEMLKGHLDMIVLAAVSVAGSAHGYAIIEEIKRRSGGAFDLPEGTIYPALHRLQQAGLLVSRWVTAESGRRRRVYALTRRGERTLAERRAVWQQFSAAIGGLLAGTPPRGWPARFLIFSSRSLVASVSVDRCHRASARM